MEPAAVLVRAFKVEVGGEAQFGALFEHRREAGPGVEPYVEDVGFALPVLAAALGALQPFGHDVLHIGFIPVVAAGGMLGEPGGNVAHPFGIVPCLSAVFAQQGQNRHAPQTLAGNAPVGALLDHVVDAFLAPARNPFHVVADGLQRLLAQFVGLHAHEPLGRGAEDDGLFAAPAMRIGVRDVGLPHQVADFLDLLDDIGVGLLHLQSGEKLHAVEVFAAIVERGIDVDAVLEADFVVLAAVSGSGMDTAGTGIERHMAAEDQRRLAVVERMAGLDEFKLLPGSGPHGLHAAHVPAARLGDAFGEFRGEHVLAPLIFDQRIFEFGMQRHGHVARQGPRGRGPDDHIGAGRIGVLEDRLEPVVGQRETDVNGRRLVVGIFHFGLGKGRLAGATPVDGLLAADHIALFHEIRQLGSRGGLVFGEHRLVGMIPVAEHAKALEFLALDIDELVRVLAAAAAYRIRRHFLFLFAKLVLNLQFDGQAVAVPAGHIHGLLPLNVAGLDGDVLEDLVQGMAEMQMAVGVGRAIVQTKRAPAARSFQHGSVNIVLFPPAQHFGFTLGEIGFHGKGCIGKIQALFVIAHGQAPYISTPKCNRKIVLQGCAVVKKERGGNAALPA